MPLFLGENKINSVGVSYDGSGLDTSDATATASDIEEGKTAYVNGEKIEGNLVNVAEFSGPTDSSSFNKSNNRLTFSLKNGSKCIFRNGANIEIWLDGDNLGDATASDVIKGKTFTSSSGLKITGAYEPSGGTTPTLQSKTATPSTSAQTITPDSGYDGLSSVTINAMPAGALNTPTISSSGLITAQVGTSGYLASGTKTTKQLTTQAAQTITPSTSDQTISSGKYLTGIQTIKGDANLVAGNIKSGVSIFGVTGSYSGSGGSSGSSDTNCEAYHITSTSATLSFKTSGTIKVWGYGYKTSMYTTTMYSFVGDGYYTGSSWGAPSKTTATFTINSNGTLSGLPSGLNGINVLVTVGV